MTVHKISANTLKRFVSVIKFFEPTTDDQTKQMLSTVRLEHKSGKSYAVVTNHKIAAIEYLGQTSEPDSAVHLKITDQLESLCVMGGTLTFTIIPEALISMVQNDYGMTVSDCCFWACEGPLNNWRKWAAPDASVSEAVMQWTLFNVETMIAASPSGKINFPQFINANKPVTVRDASYENWVGLFFPKPSTTDPAANPAKLPEWWK